MITRRTFVAGQASLIATLAAGGAAAFAQTITQSARLVVGFPAGGAADTIARLLAEQMKDFAPKLIVDNKAGAGGRIALESMKTSAADGSALILTPASMVVLFPHVYKKLAYDPLKDFTPVTTVCTAPFALVVGPKVDVSVKSVADLIGWFKANPNDASFGSPGAGSVPHFAGDKLWRAAGLKIVHVPYKGGAPLVQDVVAGHLPAAVTVLSSALPLIPSGTLRALAVTGAQRTQFLPDVPTLLEAGYKDGIAEEWYGVLAPANLPPSLLGRVNEVIRDGIKTKKVLDGFTTFGFTAAGESPEDFAKLIRTDIERWGPIVKASGFVPED